MIEDKVNIKGNTTYPQKCSQCVYFRFAQRECRSCIHYKRRIREEKHIGSAPSRA